MELFSEGYKDFAFANYGAQWRYLRKLGHTAIRYVRILKVGPTAINNLFDIVLAYLRNM